MVCSLTGQISLRHYWKKIIVEFFVRWGALTIAQKTKLFLFLDATNEAYGNGADNAIDNRHAEKHLEALHRMAGLGKRVDDWAAYHGRDDLGHRDRDIPDTHIAGKVLIRGQYIDDQCPVNALIRAIAEAEERSRHQHDAQRVRDHDKQANQRHEQARDIDHAFASDMLPEPASLEDGHQAGEGDHDAKGSGRLRGICRAHGIAHVEF